MVVEWDSRETLISFVKVDQASVMVSLAEDLQSECFPIAFMIYSCLIPNYGTWYMYWCQQVFITKKKAHMNLKINFSFKNVRLFIDLSSAKCICLFRTNLVVFEDVLPDNRSSACRHYLLLSCLLLFIWPQHMFFWTPRPVTSALVFLESSFFNFYSMTFTGSIEQQQHWFPRYLTAFTGQHCVKSLSTSNAGIAVIQKLYEKSNSAVRLMKIQVLLFPGVRGSCNLIDDSWSSTQQTTLCIYKRIICTYVIPYGKSHTETAKWSSTNSYTPPSAFLTFKEANTVGQSIVSWRGRLHRRTTHFGKQISSGIMGSPRPSIVLHT